MLGPNGKLIDIHSRSKNDHSAGNEEELPLDDRLLTNRDTVCTLCEFILSKQFSKCLFFLNFYFFIICYHYY